MGGTLIVMEYCDRGTMESVLQRREVLWWPNGSPNQVGTWRREWGGGRGWKGVTAWAWLMPHALGCASQAGLGWQ